MANNKNASGTADIGSGTPSIGSGTQSISGGTPSTASGSANVGTPPPAPSPSETFGGRIRELHDNAEKTDKQILDDQ